MRILKEKENAWFQVHEPGHPVSSLPYFESNPEIWRFKIRIQYDD